MSDEFETQRLKDENVFIKDTIASIYDTNSILARQVEAYESREAFRAKRLNDIDENLAEAVVLLKWSFRLIENTKTGREYHEQAKELLTQLGIRGYEQD